MKESDQIIVDVHKFLYPERWQDTPPNQETPTALFVLGQRINNYVLQNHLQDMKAKGNRNDR
ncbi:MAG: hypothetical protein EBT03_11085 [Betaproteobacteria bacterium]|nr:hypothetical protein [Betaproteobacteria bacterium]